MSIQTRWIKGVWAPIVVCEYCGKEIEAKNGTVLWDRDKPEEVHFTHKQCDPKDPVESEELGRVLSDLLHNATRQEG